MKQISFRVLSLAAVIALGAAGANDAQAGWHSSGGSWGSSGGSSGGSWGSSGGSWGSHGGGLLSRIRARIHAWHGSWGSHGSWGYSHSVSYSSHGSWGSSGGSSSSYSTYSWGSSGGSSSSSGYTYGSWGSSGGSSSSGGGYVVPYAAPTETYYYDGAPTPPANSPTPPANNDAAPEPPPAAARADAGTLMVSVPADAKVYVNGKPTTSLGSQRSYVSRGLRSGFKYAYEVRAEVVRDGRKIEEVKTVELRAGEISRLAFDLNPAETVATTLTLKVPDNAKVTLAGAETTSTGPVRTFSTTQLTEGQTWSDYLVQVTWEREGKVYTQEQTITLNAGDNRTLEFGVEGAQVASR